MSYHGQDWNDVVLRKKPATAGSAKTSSAVNQARRSGAEVETVRKQSGGGNTSAGVNAAKLDRETEELSHQKVSSELKKQIQQARLAKKMTQAQLANAINEKPSIINDYESGKAIPNPQILSKMSRILGVTLKKGK
uniref:HTH cro/C1-type domain-containing protein n=2 Tax=Eukaryota TaxID=2759 RepID=A0A7S3CS28_9SPIT|mmetsp:Transcript_22606/g.40262  ORF Transcript_22606/g.40262 Transcript_22606/m.40262 type:complete len:136 (+) Transcript_22606:181-588(+)|eukprot:CAMPEP_0168616294 /NCGR_PEP_ID=MMETSP0449_2-20121227/4954_1 /TAXON_ID=1082188 /ORGANISM="Strombidium rassoulzadegani, Strain ras09" /LENGTH=135 /DNA_ID=CAMNT_0008657077 /DNA_START=122 /DNA_END=529 /DNA_ORIENTATION=-